LLQGESLASVIVAGVEEACGTLDEMAAAGWQAAVHELRSAVKGSKQALEEKASGKLSQQAQAKAKKSQEQAEHALVEARRRLEVASSACKTAARHTASAAGALGALNKFGRALGVAVSDATLQQCSVAVTGALATVRPEPEMAVEAIRQLLREDPSVAARPEMGLRAALDALEEKTKEILQAPPTPLSASSLPEVVKLAKQSRARLAHLVTLAACVDRGLTTLAMLSPRKQAFAKLCEEKLEKLKELAREAAVAEEGTTAAAKAVHAKDTEALLNICV